MRTQKVLAVIALILGAATACAQATTPTAYTLPNTTDTAQWVALGTYNASQSGYDINVQIVSSNGYNANISQDQMTFIHFKSSNGNTVDANGFAGDSWWYQSGPNTNAPSQVVWVANTQGVSATAFTLYAYFGTYTGSGSYYVVNTPPGTTWTNISAGGKSNPGGGSSTVLVAQNEFYIGSTASFASNVGIGTQSPGAALEVNGNVKLTSGSGASLTFADGTTQSTAYTGTCTATGGDYAESVDVTGDKSGYEPGDVIVLDPESPGHFLLSSEPYSLLVAGIYSTKPGYVGRRQKGDPKLAKAEIPMAMIGIVPTKATTENGPIKIGDQLVTSSRPGYVMKGTDRTQMNGSVVGKAMGALKSGAGVIEVLVSLQ